jgi:hypothetical protein
LQNEGACPTQPGVEKKRKENRSRKKGAENGSDRIADQMICLALDMCHGRANVKSLYTDFIQTMYLGLWFPAFLRSPLAASTPLKDRQQSFALADVPLNRAISVGRPLP